MEFPTTELSRRIAMAAVAILWRWRDRPGSRDFDEIEEIFP
jgi:hypothetical protein